MKKDLCNYLIDNVKRANAIMNDLNSEDYNLERLKKIMHDINELVKEVSDLRLECMDKEIDYYTLIMEGGDKMKVFIVLYETGAGHRPTTLLIMRKVYGKDAIQVRRWTDTAGLSEVFTYHTANYSRAAELYLSTQEASYDRLLSVGEVSLNDRL